MKIAKQLTVAEVKKLVIRPGNHAVGGVRGLILKVYKAKSTSKASSASWVLRALIGARRRDMGLGGYSDVSLKEARARAAKMREAIREGIDPIAERKLKREKLEQELAESRDANLEVLSSKKSPQKKHAKSHHTT